jgi:hypothetical protein
MACKGQPPVSYGDEVECVKFCKLIMGSGKAIPSEPTLARSPRQASEVGGVDVASIPFGGPERARADIAEPPLAISLQTPSSTGDYWLHHPNRTE